MLHKGKGEESRTHLGNYSVLVQSLSRVQLLMTSRTAACQASLTFTISRSLFRFHAHWVNNASQPSHLLLPPSPSALNLSQHHGIPSELALRIRWPKYWSFSFSICPSNEYSGLISFRIDWFDLLAVQGTLKSLLHQHSLKASVLQHSAFFMVKLTSIYDY